MLQPGRARSGERLHDLGDLLAVRPRRRDPLLGLDDAAGRDQLHGPRDLLRGLDAADPPAELALLAASHGLGLPSLERAHETLLELLDSLLQHVLVGQAALVA